MADLTVWEAMENQINEALNPAFGEQFLITPMAQRPNKRAFLDKSREPVLVCGIFTRNLVRDDINPSANSTKGLKFTTIESRDPIIEIAACHIGYDLKQGDRLERQKDGTNYEVTSPSPNGHGIYYTKVVEIGFSRVSS